MLPLAMATDRPDPDTYYETLRRDALTPPAVPGRERDPDLEAMALGRAVQLITEAHSQYSRSGMTRPFFDFVRIVLTTKEER